MVVFLFVTPGILQQSESYDDHLFVFIFMFFLNFQIRIQMYDGIIP